MAWAITSPPVNTMVVTKTEKDLTILAIRVDTESGETEFLLSEIHKRPRWVPISEIMWAQPSS